MKVVVTQRLFDADALALLQQAGCEVQVAEPPAGLSDGDLAEGTLRGLLQDAQGWIVGHAHVTRSLLQQLPGLQVIARRGVGYERVDVAAVRELGKVATIAVGGNDAAVADHAVALMLAVAHRLREGQARLGQGDWAIPVGVDLYRSTVGVVGLGRIGRGVVARLRGFECKVVACAPRWDEEFAREQGVERVDLPGLLERSDFVSIHAPLTSGTRFLIDRAALARMKRGAILVNTARGGVVNDADLLDALQRGVIAGAGLDVFASEADASFSEATAALVRLPNVVATPHAGGSTQGSLRRTNMLAAESVVAVLRGGSLPAVRVVADGRAVPQSGSEHAAGKP